VYCADGVLQNSCRGDRGLPVESVAPQKPQLEELNNRGGGKERSCGTKLKPGEGKKGTPLKGQCWRTSALSTFNRDLGDAGRKSGASRKRKPEKRYQKLQISPASTDPLRKRDLGTIAAEIETGRFDKREKLGEKKTGR